MKEILNGIGLNDIKGISFRNNGNVAHNTVRPLADIDELHFPNRKLRRASYHLKSRNIILSKSGFDTVLTARGVHIAANSAPLT